VMIRLNITHRSPMYLQKDRLVVADPTALRYILHAPGNQFSKPKELVNVLEMTFGKGLGWAPSGS
jgi:hypothetical protein